MAEKLGAELAAKVTPELKLAFERLCEMEGTTSSGKIRALAESFVEQHRQQFQAMASIFNEQGKPE